MARTRHLLLALLAAALLIAVFPLAAVAQTDDERPRRDSVALTEEEQADRLQLLKERVTHQLERRLNALDRLATKVESSRHITDGHADALLADYAGAETVLLAGIDDVATAETTEELRAIAPPIFNDTLVFALLGPKTHAVIGSDAVGAIAARYEDLGTRLQDGLDRLAASGVDVSDAASDLVAAAELVAAAAATGGPVADRVIGLQPGDEIKEPLAAAKEALRGTRTQLGEAKELAKGVAEFIRSNLPDADSAG